MKNGNGSGTRARPHTRDDLLDMCVDVYDAAGTAERVYTNGKGEQLSVPQPDYKAQATLIRLMAELLGILKDASKSDPKAMADGELDAELQKRGYDPAQIRKGLKAVK